MAEKSGVHLTGADSGWPVAGAAEPAPKKPGTGVDGLPKAVSVAGGAITAQQEVVYITLHGGDVGTTWTLTLDGQTTSALALAATGAQLEAALEALSNVADGDLAVVGAAGGPYAITFLEAGAWGDVVPAITAEAVGVNEVQTLTVDADGGTYLVVADLIGGDSEETAAIAEDAAAATVETRLEALAQLAALDVAVTGSAGGPYTITFAGALAEQDVAALTTDPEELTGGAGTAVITTATPGKTGPTVTVEVAAEGS